MFKISEQESILLFYMGRSPLGILLYPVYAFLVGDVLIDTGTNRAGHEFLESLKDRKITGIINTHHHEDHIGNAQHRGGVPLLFTADGGQALP